MALLFGVAASPLAVTAARAAGPRVAIIVGPVGSLTAYYRADAEKAAAEARRFTDDVVTVYSPDATWSAARAAMAGASLVVYLGHGNGWPSRYSSRLNPRTQDGLGLNPVAGKGNLAHQYFGEAYLAERVDLAPNAVVILGHLCYASGNSEPGLPEGTLEMAEQRVDNFAAGFLAAGAGAVIADGYLGPAYYVRSILEGRGTVEGIWRAAPNFHGHVLAFPSTRTPGFGALMDPTARRSGFYRSLVTRADLRAGEVAAGRSGRARGTAGELAGPPTPPPGGWQVVLPPEPQAAPDAFALGARPGTPALAGMPLAAATVGLSVPVEVPAGVTLGTAYRLGTRWIPLDEATASAADPAIEPAPDAGVPAAGSSPGPAASPDPGTASVTPDPASVTPGPAAVSPGPAASLDPAAAASPDPSSGATLDPGSTGGADLVAPESAASLVDVVPATVAGGGLAATVGLPPVSGRYRLEVTLHDGDGVALPYAVQASIPGLVVRVGGPGAAWLDAPPALSLVSGTLASLQVLATNGEADRVGRLLPAAGGSAPGGSGPGARTAGSRLPGRPPRRALGGPRRRRHGGADGPRARDPGRLGPGGLAVGAGAHRARHLPAPAQPRACRGRRRPAGAGPPGHGHGRRGRHPAAPGSGGRRADGRARRPAPRTGHEPRRPAAAAGRRCRADGRADQHEPSRRAAAGAGRGRADAGAGAGRRRGPGTAARCSAAPGG